MFLLFASQQRRVNQLINENGGNLRLDVSTLPIHHQRSPNHHTYLPILYSVIQLQPPRGYSISQRRWLRFGQVTKDRQELHQLVTLGTGTIALKARNLTLEIITPKGEVRNGEIEDGEGCTLPSRVLEEVLSRKGEFIQAAADD